MHDMRDPKRIKRILKLLEHVWKQHPDMRFGQLIWFIYGKEPPFNEEDDMPGEVTITSRLSWRLLQDVGDKKCLKMKTKRKEKAQEGSRWKRS